MATELPYDLTPELAPLSWLIGSWEGQGRLGDGSAWTVGGMTTLPGEETFYPALWHQTVSLVVQLSGQDIVLASNLVMLLLGTTVWPLALMALGLAVAVAFPVGMLAARRRGGLRPDRGDPLGA